MLVSKIGFGHPVVYAVARPSFMGKANSEGDTFESNVPRNKPAFIENNLTYHAQELMDDARKLAKQYKHNEITQQHVIRAGLEQVNRYIDDLNSDKITYKDNSKFSLPMSFEQEIIADIFKDKDKRNAVQPIIKQTMSDLDEILAAMPPQEATKKVGLSKQLANDIYSVYIQEESSLDDDDDAIIPGCDELVHEDMILNAALFSTNEKLNNEFSLPFINKLKDATYLDKKTERIHIPFYDNKAENIWKNLAIGTNILILNDNNTNPDLLVNSFVSVLDNKSFGRLNKNNTQIMIMNDTGEFDKDYICNKLREFKKDKNNNHVIVMHIMDEDNSIALGESSVKMLKETPDNVKFVMIADKDKYYSDSMSSKVKNYFADFGEVTMPVMNMLEAKKAFTEQPKLMEKVKKQFSKGAIDKCVEAANQLPGNYPGKALKVMGLVSAYYLDNNKISTGDVVNYVKEAKEIFKTNDSDGSVKTLLDTGVKLKDLVGISPTKKEAQSIINRIKDNSLGTKGYIIYSQDGSVGAGRRYTAKAIAGEAKIPYTEINAVDFGTKDVNLFDEGSSTPEGSMKKLFGMVKAQAETNPHKSAVLFIENFEYFSVGEEVSEYHEKAMSQLIREMNKAQEQGFNIAVIGSSGRPDLIGEAAKKSFKFNDLIEVDSPGYNKNARIEVLDYYVKKKGVKIAGETESDKQDVLKFVAQITDRFPLIEIMGLLDKSKSVAKERGHKTIDKTDFTEAYLQLTTGRPASTEMRDFEKKIVTSHECGHAINLVVLQKLMGKRGNPWHLGSVVNFITLDPRGVYGGAVYDGRGPNNEHTFETTFSEIVCCFGGTSCEKTFYGIDGSWGITSDMAMATNAATQATMMMGQGKHFGKKSVEGMMFLSEDDQRKIDTDVNVMLTNAQAASDLIAETYSGFINEFTDKYWNKVATGECIILGETFEKEFDAWLSKRSATELEDLKASDELILGLIKNCKNGNAV
jgi:AAA+ superfamily predicted ATPase